MSATAIWIMCAIIVAGLVVWLVMVRYAVKHPGHKARREQMRGVVQGGQHVGGGRSVAPTRDAPVPPGGGDPPGMEQEMAARDGRTEETGQHRRGGSDPGNPMDL